MRHFPVYLDTKGQRIVVSGAGQTAVAKLRLILKTEADVLVYGEEPEAEIVAWAQTAKLSLTQRAVKAGDLAGARLVYAANDDETEDARVAALSRAAGALTNVVDNLEASEFITPAIVDRDPVTVAIGTEGAAPVLARKIKAMTEEALAAETGQLARIGRTFREAAEMLPQGAVRREFWSDYYGAVGPRALAAGGAPEVRRALWALLREKLAGDARPGHVHLIGAGPGDPELLTQKARRTLHEADVVIHDRLVPAPILELARREALIVEVGKIPGGQSWRQDDINALMVRHAAGGARVARLKSGDAGIFGRLDEEIEALDGAGISHDVVPGITSAAAAAAAAGISMTRRGRNSSIRFITGQDVDGFAEHDWRGLAQPGSAAAIYMGVRAARFVQGRLMVHGATAETPVTVVENASRSEQRIIATTLGSLSSTMASEGIKGPAILFYGLAARTADVLPLPIDTPHSIAGEA